MKGKIVCWNNGSYRYFEDGVTWEFENDLDWLVTIDLSKL